MRSRNVCTTSVTLTACHSLKSNRTFLWRYDVDGNNQLYLDHHVVGYFCPIITKYGFYLQIFINAPNIKFHGNPPSRSRTQRQTDMTKLTRGFRNFANANKNSENVFSLSLSIYTEPFEGTQAFISYLKKSCFNLFFQVYQQDATLYNILYYCQCSTCFRRFLRPSSGAQNCTHSIWYMSSLLAANASGSNMQA